MQLVIAEKPSVGQQLAAVLGADGKQKGYLEGGGYIVTWCVGHLLGLADAREHDEKYAKWRHEDLPIFPDPWKIVASKDRSDQLHVIAALMKRPDVDTVICATDAGREGELIFRHVYNYCRCKKPIKRLWISSMEDIAIKKGFGELRPGADYDALYDAAYCRERADWLVGINYTRLFSTLYGPKLSVGRVQTPTLAMLVERAAAIAAFVKTPFYVPEITFAEITASGEKHKDRGSAEAIRAACNGMWAEVSKVTRKEKRVSPPKLYDLTSLQRDANRKHGFTATETLTHAQSLYEKKLLTYPRTDSQYLTADMAGTAEALVQAFAPGAPCNAAQTVNDAKVSDHHAIIPTITAVGYDMPQLHAGERDILLMVIKRLLEAVGEKHVYEETEVTLACAGHEFGVKGKTIVHPGWKTDSDDTEDTEYKKEKPLPPLEEGQAFTAAASIREGYTSPPKPYTEDTLLAAMETAGAEDMPDDAERKGLGTPATRAGIIEKLVSGQTPLAARSGKNILPTDMGKILISILPDSVKSPKLTAEWEQLLLGVQRGTTTGDAFMDGIKGMVADTVRAHSAPEAEKLALLPERPAGQAGKPAGESIGQCPRCGKEVRENDKGFFCENKACTFALYKESLFFTKKRVKLTAEIAAALIKDKRVALKGLYSEKTGKTYNATVVLEDTGEKYVDFKLVFENQHN
ncbi:MAG: DNA topoisomerase 3 [Oscillospiraceae bacterium]|nr:DNA topoisomerase 3 [Oscillospiraceae bacterium]